MEQKDLIIIGAGPVKELGLDLHRISPDKILVKVA